MNILNNITQNLMHKNLSQYNTAELPIQKGPAGSVYVQAENKEIPQWSIKGKSDFDRFIKRYGLTAIDSDGKELNWTMASRGTIESSGNVSLIVPIYTDKLGRKWTVLQEEARPIDLGRNGSNSRLIAFPAGCIGDEVVGETAMESALREITEETGLEAKTIECINPTKIVNGEKIPVSISSTPGLTDEATDYFVATIKDLKPVSKATTDGGITRGWWYVPLKNITKWFDNMAKQGKVATGQTLTALQLMIQKGKIKL